MATVRSIALVEGGEVQHAVVFDPLRNELFTASRGSGAVLNDKRIRIAERRDLAGSLLATGFHPRERVRTAPQLECVRELLRDAEDIRRAGSAALDLAYVACGRLDGYFEAGVKPWDIAAGIVIALEAGAMVGSPFGAEVLPEDNFVAGVGLFEDLKHTIAAAGHYRPDVGLVPPDLGR